MVRTETITHARPLNRLGEANARAEQVAAQDALRALQGHPLGKDARILENARKVHPGIEYLALSSPTGEGLDEWLHWSNALQHKMQQEAAAASF